jgi:hypothetical protein
MTSQRVAIAAKRARAEAIWTGHYHLGRADLLRFEAYPAGRP